MIRKNFKKDPLNLKNKIIVFNKSLYKFSDSWVYGPKSYGYDFPKGFKAKVIKYEESQISIDAISFSLNFKEFIDYNRILWKPKWEDIVNGKKQKKLTWEQCPSFYFGPKINFELYFSEIFDLPFTPID